MTTAPQENLAPLKPLRLWPGVVIVVLQWLVAFVLPRVTPEAGVVGALGALVGVIAVLMWWAFFSRVPHLDRWGAVVLVVVTLAATPRLLHESMATAGQGVLYFVYAAPVLSLALVAWAAASRHLTTTRRCALVAAIVIACGAWTLVRTDGVTGDGSSQFAWRWSATAEERLLARPGDDAPAGLSAPAVVAPNAYWPGFRGTARNGVVGGVRIATDWSAKPPVELWRRPIGPGWSSFAVHGDRLYTQEQRGDDEIVSSYSLSTGAPIWQHRDNARFYESNGGAGPRGTPTLSGDRLYTFGATGLLNALDATDGTVVWSRDVASDTGVKIPGWGFASSPLVVGDIVIVAAAGQLVGYDLATGQSRWFGPDGRGGYSSPHLLTIAGVEQVLLLSGAGATSLAPSDGKLLWAHAWPGAAIVQPALTTGGDLLISTGGAAGGIGTRRITVANEPGGWTTEEVWTSIRLKPYFNDFVVHGDHAYGFDGSILACMDVEDGSRTWKGGRYGNGQLVLLPEQNLLLVLTEEGDLALVSATPDQFTELTRFPAIDGKTWNHPVLIKDLLLVRNGQEMVAFRLPTIAG